MGFSLHPAFVDVLPPGSPEFHLIPPPLRRMPRSLLRHIYTYDVAPSRTATRINTRTPTANPPYDGTSNTTKSHPTPRPPSAFSQEAEKGVR